ncbi:MAG: hypothetical protein ICV62_04975 [Cyanobacteria bacterium Co-bin13]|nr:hypothetical protein [Cyanobacteria bacterium Co-bin13]
MMKTSLILASHRQHPGRCHSGLIPSMTPVLALLLLTGGTVSLSQTAASAQSAATMLAQVYDVPLPTPGLGLEVPSYPAPPPTPNAYANAGGLPTGEQYIVYVSGSDPLLLDQLRSIEPEAFETSHQGQSVIQVGRYSVYQNAQQQVSTLSSQGIGAQIAQVGAVVPTYGQLPTPPPTAYISSGDLPPLPVVPGPQGSIPVVPVPTVPTAAAPNVEFGQPPSVYSGPTSGNEMPLPPSSPPTTAAVVPPATAGAPFYVVIPAATQDLPAISSRLVELGTPADRVQQRQSRLGPNVAVGPFNDRGLAERWRGYFREAGYGSSRVVYEP